MERCTGMNRPSAYKKRRRRNNCLKDVLKLTPIIDLTTLFCILNIFLFELSSFAPPQIVFQTVKAIGTLQNKN